MRHQKLLSHVVEHLRQDNYVVARDLLTNHLSRHKNDAAALRLLGLTHVQEGDLGAAEALFRAALLQTPNDNVIRYDLAIVLIKRGLISRAVAELNRLYQDSTYREKASNILGHLHQLRARQNDAIRRNTPSDEQHQLPSLSTMLEKPVTDLRRSEQEDFAKSLFADASASKSAAQEQVSTTIQAHVSPVSADAHEAVTLIPMSALSEPSGLSVLAPRVDDGDDFVVGHMGDQMTLRVNRSLYVREAAVLSSQGQLQFGTPVRHVRGQEIPCGIYNTWLSPVAGAGELTLSLKGHFPHRISISAESVWLCDDVLLAAGGRISFENGHSNQVQNHSMTHFYGRGHLLVQTPTLSLKEVELTGERLRIRAENLLGYKGALTVRQITSSAIEQPGEWLELCGIGSVYTL